MASCWETSGAHSVVPAPGSAPALGQVLRATLPLYTVRRLRPRPVPAGGARAQRIGPGLGGAAAARGLAGSAGWGPAARRWALRPLEAEAPRVRRRGRGYFCLSLTFLSTATPYCY